MNKKQFNAILKNNMKTRGDLVLKISKTTDKDAKTKLLLSFLGYTTQYISILTVGKDLEMIKTETANREITKAINDNKETYSQLTLLRQ